MLKNIRRAIQWSLFLIFFTGFLSFIPASTAALSALLPKLQFFPAIRRFPAAVLLILLTTLLFGRIYCSTLCPLATVQDILTGRKRRFSFRKPALLKRYLIPALSLTVLTAGFPALASLVDPYSLTGRIVSSINELIILPFIDLLGFMLRHFSIYMTTYPIQFRWITIAVSLVSAAVLYYLSRRGGRLFCNSLCPVGAILSIPARWSVFAHRINAENCTSCGACESVCKAEAISSSLKFIDTSRCISCFNCSRVCQFDALEFGRKKSGSKVKRNAGTSLHKQTSESRRDFLKKSSFASFFLILLPVLYRGRTISAISGSASTAAVPPGSGSRSHFLSKCTSCSLCISRCPGNVLQPAAFSQYGLTGTGVPYMDFNKGSCGYECNLCSELCPSGAIRPIELENKKRVKIGEVVFVKKFCVVETDGTSCGACGEICPSGAIDMLHIGDSPEGALEIPVINQKLWVGCGSCQFVCPVEEKNAIYIEALEPHGRAEVREENDDSPPEEVNNDFAF